MKVLFQAFCLSSARTNPTAGFCRNLLYPELWCGTSVKQLVILVILPQIPSFCTVIILALWMQNNALSFRGLAASFELCEAEILCFVAEKMKMKWRLAQRHSWGGTSGEWGTRSGLMAAGTEAICWSRTVLPAGHCVTWPYAPCAVRTGLLEQRVWVNMERGRGEYQVQARVETGENPARPGEVTLPCRGAMAWWCRYVLPQPDQLFRDTPWVRCPWRGLRPLGDAQTALGAPKSCRLCRCRPLGSLWEEAMGKWERDPWESSPVVSQARPGVVINSNKTLLVRKKTWLASHFELENELEMGDVKFHEQSLVSGQK